MKKLFTVMLCVFFLAACGGGGGGSASLWPVTAVTGNVIFPDANLSVQDVLAPDGTNLEFYSFSIATATDVTVRMESATFDTYLYVLQGAALNDPDINNWGVYLLYENDDIDISTTNSEIQMLNLAAGDYVIATNSFFPIAAGDYRLTVTFGTTTIAPVYQYMQYRTYDTQGTDNFRAFITFKDNGQDIQPADILSVELFEQNGMPFSALVPAVSPIFFSATYTIAAWNAVNTQFESIAPNSDSGYFLDLSNYVSIASSNYTFLAQPATGHTLLVDVFFPPQTFLVPVASTSMSYLWNPDDSLTLSWTEPIDAFDQYRVNFKDASGNDLFYGRMDPGVSQVILSSALVLEISTTGQLVGPTTINWSMQTRSYSGNNNYARSVSDSKPIPWP